MRYLVAVLAALASVAAVAADDYRESRDLSLPAGGLELLVIDVGAGSLDVRGVAGQDTIDVRATIVVYEADEDEGRKFASKRVDISLERKGDAAHLVTRIRQPRMGWGSGGSVDVEVTAPPTLALRIDDSSGSLDVADFAADVAIEDGSGSIDVRNVANLSIDDGSGSIDVAGVAGDVYVNDGSGSIEIEAVDGSVTIDDGSGSIRVKHVGQDLIIVESGSGSVSFSDIRGTVQQDR